MKPVLTALLIACASSTVIAATPDTAAPAQARPAPTVEAPAPSAERIELARQFVNLSTPTDVMLEGLRQGFWIGASESLADVEDEKEHEAIVARVEQLLDRLEPKFLAQIPGVLEVQSQLYAREFTVEELRHMVTFAQSPAGKHYMSSFLDLASDPSLMDAQADMMTGIAPVLDEFRKELCQEKAAKRLAAGDTKAKCALTKEPETLSS